MSAVFAVGTASADTFVGLDTEDETSTSFTPGSSLIISDPTNDEGTETGDTNQITVAPGAGNDVVVTDAAVLNAGAGCDQVNDNTVVCHPPRPLTDLEAFLGDGNDSFLLNLALSRFPASEDNPDAPDFTPTAFISGADGNDTIVATDSANVHDFISGGEGDDVLIGREGDDTISEYGTDLAPGDDPLENDEVRVSGSDTIDAGAGDDVVDGGFGADRLDGGPGLDQIEYDGRRLDIGVNLTPGPNNAPSLGNGAAGENDSLVNFEDASSGRGNDSLTGDDEPNLLFGSLGNDTLTGGFASDILNGSDGNDVFQAQDALADVIRCGIGNDTGTVDNVDVLSGSCNGKPFNVVPVPPTVVEPDTVDPIVSITELRRTMSRRRFFRRGVRGILRANEAVTASLSLTGRLRRKRNVIAAKAGDVVFRQKRATVGPTTPAAFKLKVARRYRKTFPRRFRMKVTVLSTDAGGNQTRTVRGVRVR